MQLNLFIFFGILSDAVAFTRVDAPVSHELAALGLFLQGMAAAICLSDFSLRNHGDVFISRHCRISVSRLPIPVLLFFELSRAWTTLQVTHDLVE